MNGQIFEQYLAGLESMDRNRNAAFRNLDKYEDRIHLSFTKWNEENYYDFLFDFVKVPSYTSLASYRTNIKKLTEWVISEKKEIDGEILEKNIFDESNRLDMESLVIQMSTRMELVYFDEDMLDEICNSIVLNRYYMELVFRLFYAGFPSVMSIVELKEDMIDLENKCIHLEYGRKIPVDVKLESAIQRMLNNEIKEAQYPDSDKVKPLLKEKEEDFLRFTTIKEDKENDNKRRFINKLIRITQTQLNMELLPKRFYHSGILNYLYRKMGRETTIQLLSENGREKRGASNYVLDKALIEGGYKISSAEVKKIFKPYIMKNTTS